MKTGLSGLACLRLRYDGSLYYYMPTDAVTYGLMTMNQVYNHWQSGPYCEKDQPDFGTGGDDACSPDGLRDHHQFCLHQL